MDAKPLRRAASSSPEALPYGEVPTAQVGPWPQEPSQLALERRRLAAFPLAFAMALVLTGTDVGAFIGQTCFGMWLHELGHAAAAWLCGAWAVPLPWFTLNFGRSPLTSVVFFGSCAALAWLGVRDARPPLWRAAALLGLAGATGHLLSASSQALLFTFGGDAGAMLLGALLSTAFLLPPGAALSRGGLRWGWLLIGALSWADATQRWVRARRDPANLPFGLENGTASDATKLVEQFGWDEASMVARFLTVAAVAAAGALGAWGLASWQTRRRLRGRATHAR